MALTLVATLLPASLASADGPPARASTSESPTSGASPSSADANGTVRWGLVAGGLLLFAGSYSVAAAMGLGARTCNGAVGSPCGLIFPRLVIPVVGPFTYVRGSTGALGNGALLTDGLLQVAGLGIAILGVVWRKPAESSQAAGGVSWTPFVSHRGAGVAGSF